MLYLFQAEYGQILTPLVSAVVTGLITYFVTRGKNTGDATKALTESCEILARQVKTAYEQLPIFQAKIQENNKQIASLIQDRDQWKIKAVEYEKEIALLRTDAALVVEEIANLAFIPTGEPTEADETAIRRLKNMRDAAKRMQGA